MRFLIVLLFLISCEPATKKEDKSSNRQLQKMGGPADSQKRFQELWVSGEGLNGVESVLFDPKRKYIYASCGFEYKPGNRGYISRITDAGQMLDSIWVGNLSRPTGMALYRDTLYVADVDVLLLIDPDLGQVVGRIDEPFDGSGLNDVGIGPDGGIYVTASFRHSVYRLKNGSLEPWMRNDSLLQWANGIITSQDHLVVAGQHLVAIDPSKKAVQRIQMQPYITDFDGITRDSAGGYYLSTVDKSALWYLNAGIELTKVMQDSFYVGDMDYDAVTSRLFLPTGHHASATYAVRAYKVD